MPKRLQSRLNREKKMNMKNLRKLSLSNTELERTVGAELNGEETRQILGGFADTEDSYKSCSGLFSGGCKPGCKPGCVPGNK